ncbi:MAG TPA: glycosyltransferase family 4 protein [Bryobacteraceae bacterium]|jgi:glycosyltransferase involved in cell wall biosynthesis|nr:glycosyltransferase family 4 protein [Bryobacteraceae bacterium]
MRILLVSSSYAPVLGGLQTATHALAREFIARGHDVLVAANRYPRALARAEEINGVQVRRLAFMKPELDQIRLRRGDLFFAGCALYPFTLLALWRICRKFRPDVVNVHFPLSQIPFMLWLRKRFSFRLVVSLHGSEVLGLSSPVRRSRLRAILREAHAVTACSRYLLSKAVDLEPEVGLTGSVIHNGIDPRRFADRTPFPHPRSYIFAFGRLTYSKGFDLLLRAFAKLAADFPAVDLIIGGEGEEREAIEQTAASLKLDGRAIFPGRLDPEEVVRYLNGCRFLVIPSRSETFGIIALEGLAAGKPVLATNSGGLPETLRAWPEGTLLVQPSVDGLLEGMTAWLHGEMPQRSERNTPGSIPTWSECACQYLGAFQRTR